MDSFDDQIQGQMSITDLFEPPERLLAVSRIFARARKNMSLAEQKTFVYALSELRFTEKAETDVVHLDKKTLAHIVGLNTDSDHLSYDLWVRIKDLRKHSEIEFAEEDKDFYENGTLVRKVTLFKSIVRIRFDDEYLSLFTGLTSDYITMWSADIFQMKSKRSVQFYELLRQKTDTRKDVNSEGLGVRAFKELFEIPETGEGSYMRTSKQGGFNRTRFEQQVIQPLCDDLKNCKMIHLIVQSDGKLYEKVKRGNRVAGYRFYWTFTSHPAFTSPAAVQQIPKKKSGGEDLREFKAASNDNDSNRRKVIIDKKAKDLIDSFSVKGDKKPKQKKSKKNSFTDFDQRERDYEALERALLNQGMKGDTDK